MGQAEETSRILNFKRKKSQGRFKKIEPTFKLVSKDQIQLGDKVNVLADATTRMVFREHIHSRKSSTPEQKSKEPLVIIFDYSINLHYISCIDFFQDYKLVCFVYKYDIYHRLLAVMTTSFRFYRSCSAFWRYYYSTYDIESM